MGKYLVAISTGLTSGVASYTWANVAPATDTLVNFFGVSKSVLSWSYAAFYGGSLFGLFFGPCLLCMFPTRKLMIVASTVILVGTGIRMGSILESHTGYILLLIGNFIVGLPVPILINIPTMVSIKWFPPILQTTAVGLNMICSGILSALGYLLSAFVMTSVSQDIWIAINATGVGLALLAVILCLIFVHEPNDKFVPKYHEPNGSKYNIWQSMGRVCEELSFLTAFVMVAYSLSISVVWNVQLTLITSLTDIGISRYDANVAGTIMQVAGLPGVIVACLLSDRLGILKKIVTFFLLPVFGSVILLGERTILTSLGTDIGSIYGFSALAGFFLSMVSPLMFSIIADALFPITIPITFMYVGAQLVAAILYGVTQTVVISTSWYVQYGILAAAACFATAAWWVKLKKSERNLSEVIYTSVPL